MIEKDAASGRVTLGPLDALRTRSVAIRAARLHRPGSRVDRVKLRYRQRPLAASVAGAPPEGRHGRLQIELSDDADGAAPGQLACLMDGELVVGWGTITRRRARAQRTLKSACRTSSSASLVQNTPVGGAPLRHDPPDLPGLAIQAKASTLG